MKNKKGLMFAIITTLFLIVILIGVSFAVFSFSGAGTKENVITTGVVTLDFDNVLGSSDFKTINVDNQYPIDDTNGVNVDNIKAKASFSVKANYNADMKVNYEVGITDINDNFSDDFEQISADYVKVILLDEAGNLLVGTKSGDKYTGVTVDSLKSIEGPNNLIKNYYLVNGLFTNTDKLDCYTMYAYLDKGYELSVDPAGSTISNGGVVNSGNSDGSNKSYKTTKKAGFSFKLIVKAAQI